MDKTKHREFAMKRMVTFFVIALFAIGIFNTAIAQDKLELLGRWAYGPAKAVDYNASVVCISNGSVLEIYGVNNTVPYLSKASEVTLPDMITDIQIAGSAAAGFYAYVTCGKAGLQVVSVASASIVGHYNTEGFSKSVFKQGNYAYIADGNNGLVILNVTTQSNPTYVNTLEYNVAVNTPADLVDIDIDGNTAYIAATNYGIFALDITTPNTPARLDSSVTNGTANAVHIENNNAYIADGIVGITVLDVTTPATIPEATLADTYSPAASVDFKDVYVLSAMAYVSDDLFGLRILNMSGSPTEDGSQRTVGQSMKISMDVNNENVFIADGGHGLMMFDVTTPASPAKLDSASTGDVVMDVLVEDQVTFVAAGLSGLWILNNQETNENTTTVLAHIDTLLNCQGLAIHNDTLFVADARNGINLYDMQNPSVPVRIASRAVPGGAYDIALNLADEEAIIASGNTGLQRIDYSTPNTIPVPTPINLGAPSPFITHVLAEGVRDIVYASSSADGVYIIDLGTYSQASTLPTVTSPMATDFIPSDSSLVVADGAAGLRLYNVVDYASPLLLDTYDTPGNAHDVLLSEDYGFVADGQGTVRMIDLTGATPTEADSFHTIGLSQGLDIQNDTLVVADGEGGVYFLKAALEGVLELVEDTLNYGQVALNADSSRILQLTNTGFATLHVNSISSPPGRAEAQDSNFDVDPGQTYNVTVNFSAGQVGSYTDSLYVYYNSNQDTLIAIVVANVFQTQGQLVAEIDTVRFRPTRTNDTRTIPLKINNIGTGVANISRINLATGPFSLTNFVDYINAGDSTFLFIQYSPDDAVETEMTMEIISDAVNDTLPVLLTGEAVDYTPLAAYEPDYYTYGLYHMNVLDEDTINDASNYGYMDAVRRGSTLSAADQGYFDQAMIFDNPGDSVYVQVDSMNFLPEWKGFTVDLWFKLANAPTDSSMLMQMVDTRLGRLTEMMELGVYKTPANKILLYGMSIDDNTPDPIEWKYVVSDSSGSGLSLNTWYHAALTMSNTVSLYWNGVLQDTVALNKGGQDPVGNFRIRLGNNVGGSKPLNGMMDEVRISGIEREPWEFNVSTGHVQLTQEDLNFGSVQLETSRTRYLYVTNNGGGVLTLDSLRNKTSHFLVPDESYALEPGYTQWIPIVYTPSATAIQRDTILIYSNDLETPVTRVPMSGYGYRQVETGPYAADAYTTGLWHLDGTPGVDTTIAAAGGQTGYFRGVGIDWTTLYKRYGSTSLYYNGGWVWMPRGSNQTGGSEPFTIETWFNLADKPAVGSSYTLMRQGYDDSTFFEIILGDTTTGMNANIYRDDGTFVPLNIPYGMFERNSWYHLAYSWDFDSLRLYLNGALVADTVFTGTARTSLAGFSWGSDYGNGSAFNGYMDEVRFSNIARAADEFTQVLPELYVLPEINFGEVVIGQTGDQYFTIENNGFQPLAISDINWNNTVFTVSDTAFNIQENASFVDTVSFTPTTTGLIRDSLLILNNDPIHDSTYVVLNGVGIEGPVLLVSSILEFGSVQTGVDTTKELIIQNIGDRTLIVDTLILSSSVFTVPDTPIEINPDGIFSLPVTFTPVLSQLYEGTLTIKANTLPALTNVTLTGSGKTYRYKKPYWIDDYTIALYHMEEGADSSRVYDATGTHHGTLTNGAAHTDSSMGYFNQGVHFDGIDDYVSIAKNTEISFDVVSTNVTARESFTVECFFRTDTINQTLFSKDISGGTQVPNYYLDINDKGQLEILNNVAGEIRVCDGAWHHVAYVYNASSQMIYVYLDGVLHLTHELVNRQLDSNNDGALILGAQQRSQSVYQKYFEGYMDEVRISNIARSSVDFAFEYTSGITVVSRPIIPKWGVNLNLDIEIATKRPAQHAALFYRKGGRLSYAKVSLDTITPTNDDVYSYTIPGDSVGFTGLEFYVEVNTDSGLFTQPVYNPKNKPMTKQVRFNRVVSSREIKAKEYQMISIPAMLDKPHIDDVLADDLGAYNPFHWRSFTWDYFDYEEYSDTLAYEDSVLFNAHPGQAFWVITAEKKTFDIDSGYTVMLEEFDFALQPHWNMIGNPFPFDVKWDDCVLYSDSVSTLFHRYSKGYRTDWPLFKPWYGYWVYNYTTEYQTLTVPSRGAGRMSKSALPKQGVLAELNETDWVVRLSLIHDKAEDLDNFAGARIGSNDTWDLRDRPEPPPIGDYVSLAFDHDDWVKYPGQYGADIRTPGQSGHTWNFTITSNLKHESVKLNWEFIQNLPEGFQAFVIDVDNGVSIDLQENKEFYFKTEKTEATNKAFQLIVGTEEYLKGATDVPLKPVEFSLHQNYPNPFNPTTHIKYAIPKNGRVKISVFNMLGQRVRVLVDEEQKTGVHEVEWNGLNEQQVRAASGIYFCRLEFPGNVAVKKMVLVK